MVSKKTSESKRREKKLLLYREIIDVGKCRELCRLKDCKDKTLTRLRQQLEEEVEPGKDFWWCPLTDIELLAVKSINCPLKIAVVSDGKTAIVCELPNEIQDAMFVKFE